MAALISIKKLNKYYPVGSGKFHALKDIDLEINEGEMVAVMGKSGSGKSTLLNIIGTLDGFDDGEYTYNGRDVGKMSDGAKASLRAREIGFVNQEFLLLNRKTARENVMLPLYYNDTPFRDMKSRALEALQALDVGDQSATKITDMSGGQRQRVAIARALVISPSLILADEPTGALDRNTADDIIGRIRALNRDKGITVIIVTHDPEVASVCERTVNIVDGRIEQAE